MNEETGAFSKEPLHNEYSHGADAWQTFCLSLKSEVQTKQKKKVKDYVTPGFRKGVHAQTRGWDKMAWETKWREPKKQTEKENEIVLQAHKDFKTGEDYEAEYRLRADYDYKFAHGDTHNKYQWDSDVVLSRELEDKPILTINKVQQHNLLIINDSKQNKSDIRVRPVSDEASFEGAQMYQELIYHINYISSSENVYDKAIEWQVEAGKGYWKVITKPLGPRTFDQEIYIVQIKKPNSVYMDPDTVEPDKSDARWAIEFEDIDKELFKKENPDFADIGGTSILGNSSVGWITKDKIRQANYYKKEEKPEVLVSFLNVKGEREEGYLSELNEDGREYYKTVKNNPESRERDVVTDNITIYKIAGDRVIKKTPWLGSTIPIVALPGVETVIDDVYDCCGHTRALINAQQMYNYNTSANIEYGAMQTKSPYIAPALAIEGYEEYYKTANSKNHSYLPYNQYDDEGNKLDAPQRAGVPQVGMAYVESMKIAQNEMMMASGQWQSQVGENENAKSGVAINARQRQGDRATYHFIDNQAIAIRRTGKILIDLIPKVYDTKRIIKIIGRDGTKKHITIDPNAIDGYTQQENLNRDKDVGKQIQQFIFNPNFGTYDILSDTGPSYATKRQEAANALGQIAAQNKEFLQVGGDIYFGMLDFEDADVLAERYRRTMPPNITGDAPSPQTEQLMHQASDKIQQLQQAVAVLSQKLEDKTLDQSIDIRKIELEEKKVSVEQQRLDYDSETKRVTALGNAGPGISVEQIQPVLKELLRGMIANGELAAGAPGPHEGGSPIMLPPEPETPPAATPAPPQAAPAANPVGGKETPEEAGEWPPIMGAKKGKDKNWYIEHPAGGYAKVETNGKKNKFDPAKIGAKKAEDGNWYVPHHSNPGMYLKVLHGSS